VDPVCGDGAIAGDESCDDGNPWGGDGCRPDCSSEDGLLESEPNDDPLEPQDPAGAATIHGALPSGDRDCYAVSVDEAGFVSAAVVPDDGDSCGAEMVLELYDSEGVRIASGLPGRNGCAALDASQDTWLHYLVAGDYAVCVGVIFESVVPAYTLSIEVGDSCDGEAPTPDATQDLEGDGIADTCDPDDDDDGVDDEADNCPVAPNGPVQPFAWDTSDEGFVRLWLLLGPFTTGVTPGNCEPSPDSFAGPTDADVAAAIGDTSGELAWFADFSWPEQSATLRFTDWFTPAAPREAYAMTWLEAPDEREAIVAVGVDDGIRVWLNGVEVGMNAGCQGVSTDQFQYPVTLQAGWNRLLTKVYDGGGGWGQIVRIYGADATTPMTDLRVSIAGATPWTDDQGDLDNDGIGDLCDPDPSQ